VTWTAFPPATEPPAAVPIVLAAVAGFVDACTFLGLFGFFVAQVTGSYVLVGAQPVAGWPGIVAVIAVPVFFAGGIAATLAAIAGQAVARRPLAAALALETLLLMGFAVMFAAGPLFEAETPAVAASIFGLAAMGVQSALVRLLMRGAASTNVMTTSTTQIAIDTTQLALTHLRRRDVLPAEAARHREACRQRLRSGLPLPLGFLLGTIAGAASFAWIGVPALAAPIAAVSALAVWAGRGEGSGPARESPPPLAGEG
jgi:uncharacterized membrane protein YoaK (UPF0700 family)